MFNRNRKRMSAEVFSSAQKQPKPRREWQYNAEKHKGKASASRVNHNRKLQVKSGNCNYYKYSFFVKIIPEWNDLPANVVEIGNLRRFKIALKSCMRIS